MSISKAMDAALGWHASLLHNKSTEIPDEFKNIVNEKAKKLGFRLVLEKVSYDSDSLSGESVEIDLDWKNMGVAPPYRDYRIAFRLRDSNDDVVSSSILLSDESVKGWLPESEVGTINRVISYKIPHSISAGNYSLDVAIVFNTNERPFRMLPIAVSGREDDGWYNLGALNIGDGSSSDSSLATIESVSVPVNHQDKDNIVDSNEESAWNNDGLQSTAHFAVNLDTDYSITKIRYKDINDREVVIKIDDNEVFTGWLSEADRYASEGYAEIVLQIPVTGSVITVETLDHWIVVKDIEIFN